MSTLKTKAIFYAYSNNALDHLAPYAFMCRQKELPCELIYGEDFIKFKVSPKNNITQIFADNDITSHNIKKKKKQGFLQIIFSYMWYFGNIIINSSFFPNFVKNKVIGLINKFYDQIDGELIGKNTAKNILEKSERVLVFIDGWSKKKKIQNGFLSGLKGKATIISVGHTPWHFHHSLSVPETSFCEDIALVSNNWESDAKSFIKKKEVTGSLRYSKKWLAVLDKYTKDKIYNKNSKKNVLILGHNPTHTSDWNRMFDLFINLAERKDINLSILPHTRGMNNFEPPKKLKNVWDKTSTLDVAVKNSDIVMFWVSSGIFEAVLRKKKVFYLSFLSKIDGEFIWQKNIPSNIIVKNEMELFKALDNYNKNEVINNLCFEKIIWPEGNDPWVKVSNFLKNYLNYK